MALLPGGDGVYSYRVSPQIPLPNGGIDAYRRMVFGTIRVGGVFDPPADGDGPGSKSASTDLANFATNASGDLLMDWPRSDETQTPPVSGLRVRTSLAPPTVSALAMTKRKFRVRANATAFVFNLQASANIAITVTAKAGSARTFLVKNVAAGRVRIPFGGRVGSARLAPGTYTATLVATRGKIKSKPVRIGLTIIA